jgi:hypothetical protein
MVIAVVMVIAIVFYIVRDRRPGVVGLLPRLATVVLLRLLCFLWLICVFWLRGFLRFCRFVGLV